MDDCTHFEELIGAELDGELSAAEKKALLKHIERCENCRRYREAVSFVSGSIAEDITEPPADFAANVMAAVKEAKPPKKKRSAKLIPFRSLGLVAAAAVALFVGIRVGTARSGASAEAPAAEPRMALAMADRAVPEAETAPAPAPEAPAEPAAPTEKATAEESTAENDFVPLAPMDNGEVSAPPERMLSGTPKRHVTLDGEELDPALSEQIAEMLRGDEPAEPPEGEPDHIVVISDGMNAQTYFIFSGEQGCWRREGEEEFFSAVLPDIIS